MATQNRSGMVRIPGGTFLMGSAEFYPEEQPVHERTLAPFWLDRHAVTNALFARFVAETGYTTVAEQSFSLSAPGGGAAQEYEPGAMVFTPPPGPVPLTDWRRWWRWQPGASWAHPEGPGTDLTGREDHPVVHVAYPDALAYAEWAGKRLPSEAEYEFAARGGREQARFAWGEDDDAPGERANVWTGPFPHAPTGRAGTAPVGSYPPDGYGLFDLIGNTWEWTSDYFLPRHRTGAATHADVDGRDLLPMLSAEGASGLPQRVLKGGSFLCTPQYCYRYRPAARSAQAEDTGMSHIGFRCAADDE